MAYLDPSIPQHLPQIYPKIKNIMFYFSTVLKTTFDHISCDQSIVYPKTFSEKKRLFTQRLFLMKKKYVILKYWTLVATTDF